MRILAMLTVFILFTGCTSLGLYSGYSVGELEYESESTGANLLKSIKTIETSNIPPGKIQTACLATSPVTSLKCAQQRNTAVVALLIQSDEMCQDHIKSIYGNEAAMNIGAGSITNLASGLATVLAAPTTKTALAAVAFFSSAEQSLINETVYKDLLTPAVVKKIREGREAKAAIFVTHFKDEIEKYPVQQALWDVIKYHQTCAFMYGLRKALEEGEKPAIGNQIAKVENRIKRMTIEYDLRLDKQTEKYRKDNVIPSTTALTTANKKEIAKDTALQLYDAEIKAAQTRLNGLNTLETSE